LFANNNFDYEAEAEFVSGKGYELGPWQCMRISATLTNNFLHDVYDVRWIVEQEDLDLWHLTFLGPSGYTDLFRDDLSRNPYKAYCVDDWPLRTFPQGESRTRHMLMLIGTDGDYEPGDPGEIVELRTLIDCAGQPSTEEPVGIWPASDPEEELPYVLQVAPQGGDYHYLYSVKDHQGNWEDIEFYADLDYDFAGGASISFDPAWQDECGDPHSWCDLDVIYIFEDSIPGGLYEIPYGFVDTSIEESLRLPPYYSDAIEQYQYVSKEAEPDWLRGGLPPPPVDSLPVATSPRLIDLDGQGGNPDMVAVFRDQTVICATTTGLTWSWSPPPPPYGGRRDYCLGAPSFSDQNGDGTLDVIISTST